MKKLVLDVFNFSDLSEIAKKNVIEQVKQSSLYDYSDIEKSELNKSTTVFDSCFKTLLNTKENVTDTIMKGVLRAAENQSEKNIFFKGSFERDYSNAVNSVEDAINLIDNCVLTGCCTDFYLTDTLISFLKGEKYNDLSYNQLIDMCKKNSKLALRKACNHYKTRKHIEECLLNEDELDWYDVNGNKLPEYILNLI
jgi:hypothetical protein